MCNYSKLEEFFKHSVVDTYSAVVTVIEKKKIKN